MMSLNVPRELRTHLVGAHDGRDAAVLPPLGFVQTSAARLGAPAVTSAQVALTNTRLKRIGARSDRARYEFQQDECKGFKAETHLYLTTSYCGL